MPPGHLDAMDIDGWVSLLLVHAQSGEVLNLVGDGPSPDPDEADAWPAGRHLPAAALRRALLRLQREPDMADPRGLRILGAFVGDRLDLTGMRVPCPLGIASSRLVNGAELNLVVVPALFLSHSWIGGTETGGEPALSMIGARTIGSIYLSGSTVSNPGGVALSLDGVHIGGDAWLTGGFKASGGVRAPRASVEGLLSLGGASLDNAGRTALDLNRARVGGGLVLTGATATGEVRALGVAISGQTNLSGTEFLNPGGVALSFDGAELTGGLITRNAFATGQVRALGASLTGPLDLSGTQISNPEGIALNLDGANVTGDVVLADGFTATGEVRGLGATIAGQLNLSAGTLSMCSGHALSLQGGRVGELVLENVDDIDGLVDLRGCVIGALLLDGAGARPVPPGRLVADGWQIDTLHGALATDVTVAQRWLETRPGPPAFAYSPQPARALAEVYERSGHPAQARRLRYTAARRVAAEAPWWAKPWLYLYGGVVGHGFYPLMTLFWLMLLFGGAVALTTTQRESFTPTDPAKAVVAAAGVSGGTSPDPTDITGETPCETLGTYPCFTPWTYALQTVVPPAAAVQSTDWQPTGWVLPAITVLKGAGWILVVLLLAGITGLLRRT